MLDSMGGLAFNNMLKSYMTHRAFAYELELPFDGWDGFSTCVASVAFEC